MSTTEKRTGYRMTKSHCMVHGATSPHSIGPRQRGSMAVRGNYGR